MSVIFPPEWKTGETWKAHDRRTRTGWFDKYAPPQSGGIDIGCDHDPLCDSFRRWDIQFGDSDCTFMAGVEDNTYQTVYASHVLEHLHDPATALRNWWRILKPTGHLIVLVPHRDLYEKKTELPSNWNGEHKTFWLPEQDEPPHTLGLLPLIFRSLPEAEIVSFAVLNEGYTESPANVHALGEYSIEAIMQKGKA